MQDRSASAGYSSTPLDYLSIVYSLLKRFPDLEHDEALSMGYEVIIRAHQTFIRLHGENDCYGYIHTSVQNAFKRACRRNAKENAVNMSLEKLVGTLKGREGVQDSMFCDPHNAYENWEFCEQIVPFIKHLDAADRAIFLFRWTHPDISLKQTAQVLSSLYPHLHIPKKQSGLTKRLQKLRNLYNAYMSRDDV